MYELTSWFPVFVVLGVLAVIGVGIGAFVLDRKRRERLMEFATARGWAYAGEDPRLVEQWPGDPFGRGERRRARNVLTGQESGRAFTAFDYSYITRSTDSKGNSSTTTHRFGVSAVPLPAYLGRVQVSPEDLFTRAAGAVGLARDIDLESEAFNRAFRVRADDPKLASDILPPRTMEYLVSMRPEAFRICGTHLLSWHKGRIDPAELVRTCAVLGRVIDGIPAFVWKDHGYDPRP